MSWTPNWLTGAPRPAPPCMVLREANHDRPCGRPSGSRTVLSYPICNDCYDAVQMIPSNILDPRRLIADRLGLNGEEIAYQDAS